MRIKIFVALNVAILSAATLPPIISADDGAPTGEAKTIERPRIEAETEAEIATQETEPPETHSYTDTDIEMLARLIYGEGRGTEIIEQAAVVWCVLNRVESADFPDTISEVITQKNQFAGYSEAFPVEPQFKSLALDVLQRWEAELSGQQSVGRVLPKEYLYFTGDGVSNHFRTDYEAAICAAMMKNTSCKAA